jgi:hypothetical protein
MCAIKYYDINEWKQHKNREKLMIPTGDIRIEASELMKKKWLYRSEKHRKVLAGIFVFWIVFSLGIHFLSKEDLLASFGLAGFLSILLPLICLKHYLHWNRQVKRLVRRYGYSVEEAKDEAWETTMLGGGCYWHR